MTRSATRAEDHLERLLTEEGRIKRDLQTRQHALIEPWDACVDAVLGGDPENLEAILEKIAHRGYLVVKSLRSLRVVRADIVGCKQSIKEEGRDGR